MKVREIMTTDVVTAQRGMSYKELAELLLEHRVAGLPVVDDEGRVIGLVTEADLMSKEAFDVRHRRPLEAVVGAVTGDR